MAAQTPSGNTAGTLVLVGMILEGIFVLVTLAVGLVYLVLIPVLGAVALSFGVLGLIWIFLIYTFSYRRIKDGAYESARAPTLVFAILSIIVLSIIPFILYLIAYIKLGDAIKEARPVAPAYAAYPPTFYGAPPPGMAAAPPPPPGAPPPGAAGVPAAGTRFCSHCGSAVPAGATFCPKCGAPV